MIPFFRLAFEAIVFAGVSERRGQDNALRGTGSV